MCTDGSCFGCRYTSHAGGGYSGGCTPVEEKPEPSAGQLSLEEVKSSRTQFEWMTRALWSDGGLFDELFQLMEGRHAKYGPGNISRHGVPGILVRMDDKLARLAHSEADFGDESYRDAWLDVINYGLIALMFMDGVWPGSEKPAS